jgi:hypothetical protein
MTIDLTQQEKNKLLRLARIADNGELAIVDEINNLEDRLNEIIVTHRGEKGDKGDKGDKGEKGDSYILTRLDKDEIAKKVKVPIVEKVIEKTERVVEKQPIVTEVVKEVAITDDGEKIVTKINQLPINPAYQIAVEHIKGLESLIKELQGSMGGKSLIGRIGDRIKIDDLTTKCDGVTKVFELEAEPKSTNKILVWGTQFPVILRPNTDFTVSGKFLTLSADISAPQSGQTLLIQYTF